MRKEYIVVMSCSLAKKGRGWPHRHKWIPARAHPRRGDVSVTFMLEGDEYDRVEMCRICPARRMLTPAQLASRPKELK